MRVTRAYELEQGRGEILRQIFLIVRNTCSDGLWHNFKSKLRIFGKLYEIECNFKIEAGMMSVEKEQFKQLDESIIIH